MKAIELLQRIKEETRGQELNCIKEILIGACDWGLTKNECRLFSDELIIDIDNHFFDIDNIPLREWLDKHCLVSNTNEKWVTIKGLK